MTTGTIADPAPAPPKGAGRFSGSRAKNDTAPSSGDSEQGFGEVMSKLQGQEKSPTAKGGAPERAHGRHVAAPSELTADEQGDGAQTGATAGLDFAVDLGALVGTEDASATAQPQDAASNPAPTNTTVIKDLAALVAMIPAQPAAGGETPVGKQPSAAGVADPAAKTRAMLDAMSSAADEPATPAENAATQGQPAEADADVGKALAAVSAPAAGQAAALAPAAKDKLQKALEGETTTTDTDTADVDAASQADDKQRPASRPKATVVLQETHFAPVARSGFNAQSDTSVGDAVQPLPGAEAKETAAAPSADVQPPSAQGAFQGTTSPAGQIADRIAQSVPAAAFADRLNATPEMPGAKSPFKVLSIQLQPAELGTVTVRMELKDGELSVHVEADRADTADLIRGDQDTLSNLLRAAGYSVDASSIKVMEGDRNLVSQVAGQQGTQTSLQSSPQWQSGSSERQGQPHRGGQSANGGETGPQPSRNEIDETAQNRAGRGLYI